MTLLEAALVRLDDDLRALDAEWALVGGVAASVLGEPRTTRDLDVVIAVADDRAAERIAFALKGRGYREFPAEPWLERKNWPRLAMVRLLVPGETVSGVVADLLFAFSGIEPEVVAAAERLEISPGFAVPVALPEHLVALKVLAGRPIDGQDARALLARLDSSARRRIEEAFVLIQQRGYHRGKDLLDELRKVEAGLI